MQNGLECSTSQFISNKLRFSKIFLFVLDKMLSRFLPSNVNLSLQKRFYTSLPYTKVHIPVMLSEVLHYLQPREGGIYCDLTFGDGGYTKAILGKY